MTGLLTTPPPTLAAAPSDGRRPLVVGALLAGIAAAGSVLVGCMAAALVAWFATDAGGHGTTRDALRVGSDAWLLAHGSGLDVGVVFVSVLPLGLTAVCGWVIYRFGVWAGATSAVGDVATLAVGAVVSAASYAVVAVIVAVLAAAPAAQPSLARTLAGAFLLALGCGGAGLAVGAKQHRWASRVPENMRAAAYGGLCAALAMVVAGGVLVAVALLLDLGAAANVLARLHADAAGGALSTVIVAGFGPNVALVGAAYLLGPGFAVGAGTSVSTSGVVLGPVPAFPLLAALPGPGPAPSWAVGMLVVPLLAGTLAGWATARAYRASGWGITAVRALAAGVAGGLMVATAVGLSGGAVGPGRMNDVGADFFDVLLAAAGLLAAGALVASLLTRWRLGVPPDGSEATADLSAEPTVRVRIRARRQHPRP